MKRFGVLLIFALVLGLTLPAFGAEFAFHGDLNNRFTLYTNQSGFYDGAGETSNFAFDLVDNRLKDDGQDDMWGGVKYRLWTEAATNDGNVKGVYGIELGNLRFGSTGGTFSGDGRNLETRWAYTDLQLPFVESKSRVKIGLAPVSVNYYLWNETAMGVQWYGSQENFDYKIAWIRGFERFRDADSGGEDVDSFIGRADLKPTEGMKLGAFVLYTNSRGDGPFGNITDVQYEKKFMAATDVDFGVYELGIDGSYKMAMNDGSLFFNWDAIYQGGDIDDVQFSATNLGTTSTQDYDVSAYFLHADVGYAWGDFQLKYTFWYASGDDDPADDDFEGFFSTDVDIFTGSTILMESYDDDNYFTERPYILDKGMIMNRIGLDYQATDKLKVGAAYMYMLAAEDVEYIDGDGVTGVSQSEDEIGHEIMGYASYKLYQNVEFAVNAAYLVAGDAMDAFEEDSIRDGSSDEDIFRSMARVRYKF